MLKTVVIGIGAAGNKAAIALAENGVVSSDEIMLINSTLKDVPLKYHDFATELVGFNGCAKKRGIARDMMRNNINSGVIDPQSLVKNTDVTFFTIVFSAEGGTGSGSSIELANALYDAGANVHLTVLCGFEDDLQGMKNTVDLFNEIHNENVYTVDTISNKKFLKVCNGNKRKAEEAANIEFCERMKILLGLNLVDGSDNIDDMDLTDVVNEPGYMDIVHGEFGRPSNIEEFNSEVKSIIDGSKSYPSDASCTKTAVILNRQEKIADNTNYAEDLIQYVYGTRQFGATHTQEVVESPNYINIIVSGMNLPEEAVKDVYEEYQKTAEANRNRTQLNDNSFGFATDNDSAIGGVRRQRGGRRNSGTFTNTSKADML